MSPVKNADPEAKSLDDAFTAAMGVTARPREPAAPTDIDPDAPFGKDSAGAAIAPYGLTKDGKVRRSNAGRRSKDDMPRIGAPESPAEASAAIAKPEAGGPGRDFTVPLSEFGDTVWFGLSALAKGGAAIPLVGKFVPEQKLGAQAWILRAYKPTLVKAVNLAAQHNTRAAGLCAKIETGDMTWTLMVGMLVLPFITMSATLWKDTDKNAALAQAEMPSAAEMAAKNDAVLDEYLSEISAQMEAMVAEQTAEAQAAVVGDQDAEQLAAAREAGIL